jgi:hypothetical protein
MIEPSSASRPPARRTLLLGGVLLLLSSCVSGATDLGLESFQGEWCTLRGLASSNNPAPGISFVGMVLFEEGGQVFGTGSVSRPGDDEILPSRYSGTVSGQTASILRTDLEDGEVPGPVFTLNLTRQGVRDLVGTMTGDPSFEGSIHLVRLGPRCFAE